MEEGKEMYKYFPTSSQIQVWLYSVKYNRAYFSTFRDIINGFISSPNYAKLRIGGTCKPSGYPFLNSDLQS